MGATPIRGWQIEVGTPEIDRISAGIQARQISQGPLTEQLEEALAARLGVAHVVCTTSGTSALMMSYLALGVGPGSEVIIPDRTWVATANAALLLGAKVRLVDVEPSRPVMDPDRLLAAITPRTRAIIPVHLNGHAASMEAILAVAEQHGIPVVEDACQAFLSRHHGRPLGTAGRMGCFSMGLAKLLTTGQGGFIACHDTADRDTLRRIRNQGLSGSSLDENITMLGGNFKFTDIQAAVGLAQMDRLDARIVRQRTIQEHYLAGLQHLPQLQTIPVNLATGEIPLRAEYLVDERAAFVQHMRLRGIEVNPHPVSLHQFPHLMAESQDFPHSLRYSGRVVTLPSGPDQPLENVAQTIDAIHSLRWQRR
ncbi:MAG: DegT/DnrJ/EryC1/StrS family aminotransferase [Magnetococcales bacterium]|nr:DegT/DnrJ/EryC1/StrS family aminotransferase [Magnetococcales bacterium]MBF0323047.1 DegT/DnrJ/EryC1/StrS family aminotransferase [Magnetococcales bacterium]